MDIGVLITSRTEYSSELDRGTGGVTDAAGAGAASVIATALVVDFTMDAVFATAAGSMAVQDSEIEAASPTAAVVLAASPEAEIAAASHTAAETFVAAAASTAEEAAASVAVVDSTAVAVVDSMAVAAVDSMAVAAGMVAAIGN
jgi:hypothetical protein